MNFGEALERVKSGKKIQREGWNGKNQFVELGSHVSYVRPNGEVVNANHEAMGNQVLVFHGTCADGNIRQNIAQIAVVFGIEHFVSAGKASFAECSQVQFSYRDNAFKHIRLA